MSLRLFALAFIGSAVGLWLVSQITEALRPVPQPLTSLALSSYFPPQSYFPALDSGHKKFNRRPVLSTIFRKKPFGENVEGLSHCGEGSCGSQIVFK